FGQRDRSRGFVEAQRWPEKQPDLLSRDDYPEVGISESIQEARTRRIRPELAVLAPQLLLQLRCQRATCGFLDRHAGDCRLRRTLSSAASLPLPSSRPLRTRAERFHHFRPVRWPFVRAGAPAEPGSAWRIPARATSDSTKFRARTVTGSAVEWRARCLRPRTRNARR